MPPSNHALLGASSAHRWLACPPSAKWELSFPETKVSEAAEEGTLAHAVAEEHMRKLLAGKKPTTSAKTKKHALYKPVMEEHVSTYTDYLMEHLTEARQTTEDALLLLEERVDYSEFVPEGFGTCDAILIADDVMHVFDFKYGKGVPVDAVNNPQIRLYAIGALEAFDGLYDIKRVVAHIIQPRLDSITFEEMTVKQLYDWVRESVVPRAKEAFEGKGKHAAGDHCRFCRCKNVCRYYAMHQLELDDLRMKGGEERLPDELSKAEIAQILMRVDELTRWASGIKEWALDQCVNHNAAFPGFKIVEGRSNRKITDEEAAIALLDEIGITADRVTKLRSLTDLEEIVGKKKLAEVLDGLIIKPAGKPVLVPESDKRPAISSTARAQGVFKPIED